MDISYSEAINDCAVECAYRRLKGACTNKFGCFECNDCDQYIKNYLPVDIDNAQVRLFMVQANRQAESTHRAVRNASSGGWAFFWLAVGVIGFFVFVNYSTKAAWAKRDLREAERRQQTTTATAAPTTSSTVRTTSTVAPVVTVDTKIRNTLDEVARRYNAREDVNSDSLTNCIDAAVLFYQLYPDRNNVRIMLNYNRNTGMNHLFNAVRINNVWRTIEPQTHVNGNRQRSYYMADFWGSTYDPRFDTVDTDRYIRFVR